VLADVRVLLVASSGTNSTTCFAQDTVRVSVEEVRIPITAKNSYGRFDPTVELNDLLVRDNGIALTARACDIFYTLSQAETCVPFAFTGIWFRSQFSR
jgi:hypothetical protein